MKPWLILSLGLLTACAMDPDELGEIDQPTHEDGVTRHMAATMSPAVNSRTAGPLTTVTLTFNARVDMTTVDETTVWMVERDSLRRVPAAVSAGATLRQVVLTPSRPLASGAHYTVHAFGVEASVSGYTPSEWSGRFFTALHDPIHMERFNESGMVSYYDAFYDPGTRVRQVDRMYTGPDRMIGGGDDLIGGRSEYTFDGVRDPRRLIVRDEPGADGTFGTPDDVISIDRRYRFISPGLYRLHNNHAGPDGLLGTPDDYDDGLNERTYDPDTDEQTHSCQIDAGGDLMAFTSDDFITSCNRFEASAGERRTILLVGPGDDGAWRTPDDVLGSPWRLQLLDADGNVVRTETHALAGDGTATPSDATLLSYVTFELDANGLVIESLGYEGAGADTLWNTSDDVAGDRDQAAYDGQGFLTLEQTFNPGPDDLHHTGDDWLFQSLDY